MIHKLMWSCFHLRKHAVSQICKVCTHNIMAGKKPVQIIGKCFFRFHVNCFFELRFLFSIFDYRIISCFCLTGRHYQTPTPCWKTRPMNPLMASSSCPVSNGTLPLTSHHQTRHLQKPVSLQNYFNLFYCLF